MGHDVLRVEDAGDVAERAAVDRQPAVGARGDDAEDVAQRRRDVDGRETVARHHQLARVAEAETKRAVEPHLFLRLEQSAVAAFGDEQPDLVRRVHVTVGRPAARAAASAGGWSCD